MLQRSRRIMAMMRDSLENCVYLCTRFIKSEIPILGASCELKMDLHYSPSLSIRSLSNNDVNYMQCSIGFYYSRFYMDSDSMMAVKFQLLKGFDNPNSESNIIEGLTQMQFNLEMFIQLVVRQLIRNTNYQLFEMIQANYQQNNYFLQIEQIQQIFSRVGTFDRVLFYNQRIADPYQLAAYGFIKKSLNIATCQACHQQIKFDTQNQALQIKQPFLEALQNHDSGCQFMNRHKKAYAKINKSTLSDLSTQIFDRVKSTHQNKQRGLTISKQSWQAVIKSKNLERWYKQFDKHYISSKQILVSDFLSILGWKRVQQEQLQCLFCGQKANISEYMTDKKRLSVDSMDEGFNALNNHRSSCLILTLDAYQIILKRKVFLMLKDTKGQLQTTERQLKARKLREQCLQIYKQNAKKWNQLSRSLRQTVQQKDAQGKLQSLKNIGQQIKQIVFSSIKKIKLN